MYARYRPTIRYPLPKFFYSKEENLSSTKYQHYVLYPTVVNARRAGKRVVSKVRMMLLFRLADGYLDDMDGELVLSHVICPFRLFLFFAVLLCGGGGEGKKKKYWVRLYSHSWVQVLLLLPFGMHICYRLHTHIHNLPNL